LVPTTSQILARWERQQRDSPQHRAHYCRKQAISLVSPKAGTPAFPDFTSPSPQRPFLAPIGSPSNANQLPNRVVQKASFQNPNFIGFFAPISKIRAGLLAKVF
jgi:hypothetical protein